VQQAEVLDIFKKCGAILEGHFILSSGLRSPVFLQKARVFMYPDKAEKLCRALAEKIYTERVEGKFELRRGFELAKGEKVIVVEDIVSTGLSIRECIDCVKSIGADVVAAACLIDRSAGEADIGVPLVSLTQYRVPAYPADQLPPELSALPAVKPGSRGLS
jgi:orotate phosphoribosyltransferase